MQWAKTHKSYSVEQWKTVLLSDETHFLVQGHKVNFVRRSTNEAETSVHVLKKPKHLSKKMFWGCLSYNGPGPFVQVEDMMNSDIYITLLQNRLVPLLSKMFPGGNRGFQPDSAPCHTSKNASIFLEFTK